MDRTFNSRMEMLRELPNLYGREHFPDEWDTLNKKDMASGIIGSMDEIDRPGDIAKHKGYWYSPSREDMFTTTAEIDRWDDISEQAYDYTMERMDSEFPKVK